MQLVQILTKENTSVLDDRSSETDLVYIVNFKTARQIHYIKYMYRRSTLFFLTGLLRSEYRILASYMWLRQHVSRLKYIAFMG